MLQVVQPVRKLSTREIAVPVLKEGMLQLQMLNAYRALMDTLMEQEELQMSLVVHVCILTDRCSLIISDIKVSRWHCAKYV